MRCHKVLIYLYKNLSFIFTQKVRVRSVNPVLSLSQVKHFIDYKQVVVQGGNGGDGCMSFASEPRKEYAGPDGGNGGNGGHIIFIGDLHLYITS